MRRSETKSPASSIRQLARLATFVPTSRLMAGLDRRLALRGLVVADVEALFTMSSKF